MKVYDCFTFYNEFELLELRLESLDSIVDYFVLVEADKTQRNEDKPFYFLENKDKFSKFLPKIRHLMMNVSDLSSAYKGDGDWIIENAQRDYIKQGLFDAQSDDLIFISDLDEIPNPQILNNIFSNQVILLAQCLLPPPPAPSVLANKFASIPCQLLVRAIELLEVSPVALNQTLHRYYLDLAKKDGFWQGTILTRYKNLPTPQKLRNLRTSLPQIANGGWHFSSMGGIDRVIEKTRIVCEGHSVEDSDTKYREFVKEMMEKGSYLGTQNNAGTRTFFPYDIRKINLPYFEKFVKKYPYFLSSSS